MKRIVNIIISLMLLSMPFITVKAIATNSSDINYVGIYYFYNDDCKECESGKKWLENYVKDDYQVSIEYIKDDNINSKVKDALNIKKDELPLTIIGSDYFVGFNEKIEKNLTKAIQSYKKVEEYCDAVLKIRNDEDIKDCIKENKGIYKQSNSFSIFAKIIIVIIGIVIISGIVILIKKNLRRFNGSLSSSVGGAKTNDK